MVERIRELILKIVGSRKWILTIIIIILSLTILKDNPNLDKILIFAGSIIGVEGLNDFVKSLKGNGGNTNGGTR